MSSCYQTTPKYKNFRDNVRRDDDVYFQLKALGWRTAVVWECATRDKKMLPDYIAQLANWLKSDDEYIEIPELIAD